MVVSKREVQWQPIWEYSSLHIYTSLMRQSSTLSHDLKITSAWGIWFNFISTLFLTQSLTFVLMGMVVCHQCHLNDNHHAIHLTEKSLLSLRHLRWLILCTVFNVAISVNVYVCSHSTCVLRFPVFLTNAMADAPTTDLWIGLIGINNNPHYWTNGQPVKYTSFQRNVSTLLFH